MRFGGGIYRPYANPDEWLRLIRELRYSAVSAPVDSSAPAGDVAAYLACARKHDILIGEVGVWRNPLSPDTAERKSAMDYAKAQLALADELGANCCVNIAGGRGEVWDGCYADNYSRDAYAMLVDSVREIIDSVSPKHTFYTLEPMPWMHPDSPEDYLQMLKDIDRPAFGVHLDYANMISGVERYLNIPAFIKRCFSLLGPHIKSIHAKDVAIGGGLPCQISEVPPGRGNVDFGLVLRLAQGLGGDTPVFVEHLSTHEEYMAASEYVHGAAEMAGVPIKEVM